MLRGEFRGVTYPVNRSGEPVAGVRSYRSIAEIGEAVDLAVICLPGDAVLDAAEDAAIGVRALCVISAGCRIGPEGEARQDLLLELVRVSWCPGARTKLPRHSCGGCPTECDVRTACASTRQDRFLVAEWRARACSTGAGRPEEPRAFGLRIHRQQGGRLVERPARVLGRRSKHRRGVALPRVLRQPAQICAGLRDESPERSRSSP